MGGHCSHLDFYLERDGAAVKALDGEATQFCVDSSKSTLPAVLRTHHGEQGWPMRGLVQGSRREILSA